MIIYIIIGLIGGFMSGFMGIGGGLVMVPLMVFLAKFTQHLAQGTSLAVLSLPVVIFGAYQYYTHGNVDIKAALIIAVMFCVGIFLGSKFAHTFSSDSLKIIFGFLMVIIGMKMIVN
ncbi:MAG: sulfite exporter TauE/SafE family protein [bacterium]|jgi:uncharacterized membrane protein YfcA|tara:strand:- start:1788 stop:2138 length:351 start_codon:yes stop_codon:yes gene_type:complete